MCQLRIFKKCISYNSVELHSQFKSSPLKSSCFLKIFSRSGEISHDTRIWQPHARQWSCKHDSAMRHRTFWLERVRQKKSLFKIQATRIFLDQNSHLDLPAAFFWKIVNKLIDMCKIVTVFTFKHYRSDLGRAGCTTLSKKWRDWWSVSAAACAFLFFFLDQFKSLFSPLNLLLWRRKKRQEMISRSWKSVEQPALPKRSSDVWRLL